jgi:hypothetical protein
MVLYGLVFHGLVLLGVVLLGMFWSCAVLFDMIGGDLRNE